MIINLKKISEMEKNEYLKNKFIQNNLKLWLRNIILHKLDKYTFFISFSSLCFLGFFLGNNLGIYIWMIVIFSILAQIYRIPRFYVKRWLMYLTQFCYFGEMIMVCFILFYPDNLEVFYISFVCCSGMNALGIIVFENKVQFHITDEVLSCFIHVCPLISVWAIRWRHFIYSQDSSFEYFNFVRLDNLKLNLKDFCTLQIYPLMFWIAWAIFYFTINSTLLKKYYGNPIYPCGIEEFKQNNSLSFIFGNRNKYTIFKYVIGHLMTFIIIWPIPMISFLSFKFNTIYVALIIFILAWNTCKAYLQTTKIVEGEKTM